MFHSKGKNTLYNPSMMLYILNELLTTDYEPERLLDDNITIDYGHLRTLFALPQNREQLCEITLNNSLPAAIVQKFSVDAMHKNANFISLLFYMGLLTIDNTMPSTLKIPNTSVRASFWNYLEQITTEQEQFEMNNSKQEATIHKLAFESDPKPFLDYINANLISRISNRDLIRFDEKYIKVMLLSRLMLTPLFDVLSEPELQKGYPDIWVARAPSFPQIPHEWIWELKYVPKSGDEQAIADAFTEARTQLQKYRASARLANRPDVRYLAIVFHGKDQYGMKEVNDSDE
jgi:hypothetical protein